MASHLKYLIVRRQEHGTVPTEHAIVFGTDLVHRDVARCHRASSMAVIAAGFCTLFPTVTAWGESESLGMKGRPEDADVIKRTLQH